MSAAGAAIAMSTQSGGTAARNRQQHFSMLPVDPLATVFDKRLSRTANNVGHLQQRPVHELYRLKCSTPWRYERMVVSAKLRRRNSSSMR